MTYLYSVWQVLSGNLGTLTVALGGMLLYFCFLRPRWKWWLYPAMLISTFIAIPMAYILFPSIFNEANAYSILMAGLGYWVDIMVLISFREHFGAIITLLFTQGILNRLATFLGYMLHIPLNASFGGNTEIWFSVTLAIVFVYFVILMVSFLLLREKGRRLIQAQLRRHDWAVLAVFTVSAKLIIDFCSDYAFNLNPYSDTDIILAMIALCIFSFAVLFLYIYSSLTTAKQSELKAASDRLTFEKEAQQRYYEAQLNNQEELRRTKHDMKGHLSTISHLLAEDNKEEAASYLAGLVDYTNSYQIKLYSEDPYLNAVVTNYATIFAQNDTVFEVEICFGRLELHHIEMCLVLNNALQNALEASLKIPMNQRYVRLDIKTKQSRFLFRISNRFNNKILMNGEIPRSTKKDTGHGYGLKSIRTAAKSLGGFVACKIEGDMFVLEVAI